MHRTWRKEPTEAQIMAPPQGPWPGFSCRCFAAPLSATGGAAILDAVVDYLPSPADVRRRGNRPQDGHIVLREQMTAEPFSASLQDQDGPQGVGKLTFSALLRQAQGRLRACSTLERAQRAIGRILRMHAIRREDA